MPDIVMTEYYEEILDFMEMVEMLGVDANVLPFVSDPEFSAARWLLLGDMLSPLAASPDVFRPIR